MVTPKKEKWEERRKEGIEEQRAKPPTSTKAFDTLLWDEKREKKRGTGADPRPNYPLGSYCKPILLILPAHRGIYIYGVGGVWVQLLGGSRGLHSCFFLFYVNVSGIRPQSRLSSQPLTIPAPWVLLRVRWSIPLFKWFHPGRLPPVSLRGIQKLS